MIRQAKESEKDRILTYIGQNYADCLYLYLNYKKYGCTSDNVKVYVSVGAGENLNGVLLKYHDSLHIYSALADMNLMECTRFIRCENPSVLFINSEYNCKLQESLAGDYGMYEMKAVEKTYRENCMIEGAYCAQRSELFEIAEFLMSDSTYNTVYASVEELATQMEEREKDGYGCTYVARENGKIAWTSSVVARDEFICLESLIMLAPHLRKKGLGKPAVATLADILLSEGMRIFAFPVEATLGINDALGYRHVSNTIKWIRKVSSSEQICDVRKGH